MARPLLPNRDHFEWVEQLAEEMAASWSQGTPLRADQVLQRHPTLQEHSAAVLRLIYEEIVLQERYASPPTLEDYASRYPQWKDSIDRLLQCHAVLEPQFRAPRFPEVGETLEDFQLLSELGRGAASRVYLAKQVSLGQRLVVLKLTSSRGSEHLSLARLLHTNIVPLYQVEHVAAHELRLLCMPYFGGHTLAQLLEELAPKRPSDRSGRDWLLAMDCLDERSETTLPRWGAAWEWFGRTTYVRSVCYLGACLADALQYAHQRNLVHLDVKPTNVLLAADGQPLLLDFHLAREPLRPGEPLPEMFGGTLAYAPPEQCRAVEALSRDEGIDEIVDGRADIYSLGVLLYETLTGELPQAEPVPPSARNRRVSVGLSDILLKCLADDPDHRYVTAADLAEDLRRHLTDRPLLGVANRSFAERWRKWRSRRPYTLTGIVVLLVLLTVGVVAGGMFWFSLQDRRERIEQANRQGHHLRQQQRHEEALATLQQGMTLAQRWPVQDDLRKQLEGELQRTHLAQRIQTLRSLVDRLHVLGGLTPTSSEQTSRVRASCRTLWKHRERLLHDLDEGEADLRRQVRQDLRSVALLWAGLQPRNDPSARQRALRILLEAEELLGPNVVLYLAMKREALACGEAETAQRAEKRGADLLCETADDHFAMGKLMLEEGDLEAATNAFRTVVALDRKRFWPRFFEGVCAYRLRRYADALAAFTACMAMGSDETLATCHFNRAMTYSALGREEEAIREYSRALQADEEFGWAYSNRGILLGRWNQYSRAIEDLERAFRHGVDPAWTHYNLAVIWDRQGQRARAESSVEEALKHNPDFPLARELQTRLRSRK